MLVISVCSENENGGKTVSLLMSNKLSEMCTMGMAFNILNKQLNRRPSEASWEEVLMQSPRTTLLHQAFRSSRAEDVGQDSVGKDCGHRVQAVTSN